MSTYLSSRLKNLKIGIEGYTEPLLVSEVIGNMDISGQLSVTTFNDGTAIAPTGSTNYVITADGAGGWTWKSISAIGVVTNPGGTDGQIQYNNNGSIAGTSQVYYDDTNNRLGVGTTTPAYLFQVNGDASFLGRVRDKDGDAGTFGQILMSTATGIDWIDAAPADAITGITIYDEGVLQGGANAVASFNVVGPNIAATVSGSAATITLSSSPNFTGLTVNSNTVWHAGNDGATSGLDADLLDGQQGTYYLDYTNLTNKPTIGNGTITISAGTGILVNGGTSGTFTLNQTTATTITIAHSDTSAQGSVDNSNGTVIQDITLDTYGHITAIGSVDLDGRYYTETEADARFLRKDTSDTLNGNLTLTGELRGPATFIIDPAVVGNNTGVVVIKGDLQIDGTTTTVNSTVVSVDDKNIILGDVASPTDVLADGGGITLRGTTDKTINWVDSTDSWTSSERFSVPLGAVGSPSLAFNGDPNTGIYSPGADQLAIGTGGTERLFIASDGKIGIGTNAPGAGLSVQNGGVDTAHFGEGTLSAGINIKTRLTALPTTGTNANIAWLESSSGYAAGSLLLGSRPGVGNIVLSATGGANLVINPTTGNVGIGTTLPTGALDVAVGGAGPARIILSQASDNPYIDFYRSDGVSAFTGARISNPSPSLGALAFFTASNAAIGSHTFTERMRIDTSGRLLVGTSTARSNLFTNYSPTFQLETAGTLTSRSASIYYNGNNNGGAVLALASSRGTAVGSNTVVQSGDELGQLAFLGADGTNAIYGAVISASVDGTPGLNDMPSRLVFGTTADGASSPTERMVIKSDGKVGIGTSAPGQALDVVGAINSQGNASTVVHFQAQDTGAATDEKTWRIAQTNRTNKTLLLGVSVNDAANTAYTPITITRSGTSLDNIQFATGTGTERARIDSSGRLLVGTSSARATLLDGTRSASFQLEGTTTSTSAAILTRNSADTGQSILYLAKSRGATNGSNTVVASGDGLGAVLFMGADGTGLIQGAAISAAVDGTPGTNDMPGRLIFSTTADGASTPTERMRIGSTGAVAIGSSITAGGASGCSLRLGNNLTGSVSPTLVLATPDIQADATSASSVFVSTVTTAASVVATDIRHFVANNFTLGSGASVTNQYGFLASSALTAATNNYGFYSNIAAATGRWNFYANGTARNYFAGNVGIGTTVADNKLTVRDGDIALTSGLNVADAGHAIRFFANGVDDSSNNFAEIKGGLVSSGTPQTGYLRFSTSGSERVRIDSSGRVLIGTSTARTSVYGNIGYLQIEGASGATRSIQLTHNGANFSCNAFTFIKTRGAGTQAVQAGDSIGLVSWQATDGTSYIEGAQIIADVDGTVATGSIPTKLSFRTTPVNAVTALDRLVIKNTGNVGIGTDNPGFRLEVNGSFAATTKSFLIPHPTKQDHKLRHGSLEGPENGVYIRGRSKDLVIELPEYWTKLVDPDSITVNLTPIGKTQTLWVKDIRDNKILIGSKCSSVEYFYMVLAERSDVEKLEVEIPLN